MVNNLLSIRRNFWKLNFNWNNILDFLKHLFVEFHLEQSVLITFMYNILYGMTKALHLNEILILSYIGQIQHARQLLLKMIIKYIYIYIYK